MTGRALVTGAGGFIGRATVSRLRRSGWDVRSAHRRDDPSADAVVDVGPSTDWSSVLDGVDTVVHLAARVHVMKDAAEDPAAEFQRVNTAGTARLATAAAATGVRRFLFLSTAGVLGTSSSNPLPESAPVRPENEYARSKAAAERALAEIDGGMEVVILRPPLVYGPDAPGNFARLGSVVRRGVPLPLGAATALRSFISLDNLVDAMAVCLAPTGRRHAVYHVTDGEDVSTADLIGRIATAMGKRSRLVGVPLPALRAIGRLTRRSEDVARLVDGFRLDASAFAAAHDWSPPLTLDEGLARTFAGR